MMDRRVVIATWALGALAAIRRAEAQAKDRVYRVGILRTGARPLSSSDLQATGMQNALRELGYVEGRNLIVEQRFAAGDFERLPVLARELVQARVDVIIAVAAPAVRAAMQVAPTTPIVMFGNFEPVALGWVASLAKPGGNVTGILIAPDGTMGGKRLELLKLTVPQATRIAFLVPPDEPSIRFQVEETRKAAATLGVELATVEVRGWDYASAFAAVAARRPGALLVAANTSFLRDRLKIIELAAQHRLPAMYEWRETVVDGGLMAYSTSLYGLYQRVAATVDRILKGANPGDLPIERPAKFEWVINRKTAHALGLTLPPALLLRVDEVIE